MGWVRVAVVFGRSRVAGLGERFGMSDNTQRVSPFEQIRHEAEGGGEYWSARELAKVLDYSGWQRFMGVIARAQTACENSGQRITDHFNTDVNMVTLGSGAIREVEDWHLSRYACYLVVQNADPEKPIVALGQTYFAIQTRRAELAGELTGLTEAQRRIVLRDQAAARNVDLAAAVYEAGVVTQQDFATFQNHGYRGLYDGETAQDIAARKGLKRGQKVLDWMGSEELAANFFRITQTEAKIRREGIQGKDAANQTHYDVGKRVRETIEDLGGTPPEQLPTPTKSIEQIRRDEQKRLASSTEQSLLFGDDGE
ncbi:MAG: DNA-damage-inducible protein D [Ktedonobacterales bacterium]|jgi:DNA-damage-inducible protein D|nr:MAG: DNA-damage-inducible protein D [Ktedonobacterales bacterium]